MRNSVPDPRCRVRLRVRFEDSWRWRGVPVTPAPPGRGGEIAPAHSVVWGLGFGVWVWGLVFRVWGLGFGVRGFVENQGLGGIRFRIYGSLSMVYDLWCRV